MVLQWTVSRAKPADADAIASLLGQCWTSPFVRLQFGRVDTAALAATMSPAIARQIEGSQTLFIVARHDDSGEVLSVAQWSLPDYDAANERTFDSRESHDDRIEFDDEAYRQSLPEYSNKDLILEFTRSLRSLKYQVLKGRPHFMLENLATHPAYRRQGMASHLIRWALQQADERNFAMYLTTERNNPAIRTYRRLGFEEAESYTMRNLERFVARPDIDKYMDCSDYTHVAFVRYPNGAE